LKAHSQCLLLLLVKVGQRKGETLGSEGGKALGSGFFLCVKRRKEFSRLFITLDLNFDISVGMTTFG
jgi:hypothetical protein